MLLIFVVMSRELLYINICAVDDMLHYVLSVKLMSKIICSFSQICNSKTAGFLPF